MKKLIAAVTSAGLLIVGTAGVAQAAESPSSGRERPALGQGRRLVAAGQVAAGVIGIEPKALAEAVRGGQSVADVARSHNVEPQAVIDAVVASANTRIDQAVAEGKITAERAATVKEKLPTRITKLVNGELKRRGNPRAKARRHVRRAGVKVAAETIGIEPRALVDAVKGGQSVADVARSHDVEPQAVIDAIVAAATSKLDQAVADGKVRERRAERIKERLPQRAERLVNATPGERSGASS